MTREVASEAPASLWLGPILAAAAATWAAFIARTLFLVDGRWYSTLFDDAMISMRYARNLAGGHGLVWNAGGDRVQGYSNPAWTIAMAAVHAAGVPPRLTSLVIMCTGMMVLLATVLVTYGLARQLTDRARVAVAAAALTAFAYALVFWTLRGTEVGVIALLVTFAASRAIAYGRDGRPRQLALVGIALIVAMWTRLDSVVASIVILTFVIAGCRRRAGLVLAWTAAVFMFGGALPLALSKWYYGDFLPNTFYLKLGGTSLTTRLGRGLPALFVFALRGLLPAAIPAAALACGSAHDAGRRRRELGLLAAIVAAQCAYSAYVGGDAWEWMGYANRYIAIAMPVTAVLTVAGVDAVLIGDAWPRRVALLLTAALALQAWAVLHLLRSGSGIDAVGVYRTHPGALTAALVAVMLAESALAAFALARRRFALVVAAVWLMTSGMPFARWAIDGAIYSREDARAARFGLLAKRTLHPSASLALVWAGSAPYFSERPAIDLLGKSDPLIARMSPRQAFFPGHDKWDLRHSIGELQPDLVCGLPRAPGELEYLSAQRYHPIGGSCFVSAHARVDEERLTAGLTAISPRVILTAGAP